MTENTTIPVDTLAPARTREPSPFVPPKLNALGRVYEITLGSGTNPFSDGIFGS